MPKRALHRRTGFTLVEVLIALLIFSMVMGLAAYSFRFYIGLVPKIVFPFPEEAILFSRLDKAIKGTFSYVGEKENIAGRSRFYTFFYGKEDEMEFITTQPILGTSLSVCRLYYSDGQLIWEESPVYGKEEDYKEPKIASVKKEKVLMKNITNFRFEYYKNGKTLFSGINEDLPTLVAVHFVRDGVEKTYYFKLQSDFRKKKSFTEYIHAPF